MTESEGETPPSTPSAEEAKKEKKKKKKEKRLKLEEAEAEAEDTGPEAQVSASVTELCSRKKLLKLVCIFQQCDSCFHHGFSLQAVESAKKKKKKKKQKEGDTE